MARKVSRRCSRLALKFDKHMFYQVNEALSLVKECAVSKFNESIDVAVVLGIDPKKSDQNVRGSLILPAGVGKVVRVAVFAQGSKADDAIEAGADVVGADDLAARVKEGFVDFDIVITTPDMMRIVGQLGQILGPRGLMPNPKVGTVAVDVAKAVKDAKSGQVQYRSDKTGIIHCPIGRASFDIAQLKENLVALLAALNRSKPETSKGTYIRRLVVNSTMGIGVRVDLASFG